MTPIHCGTAMTGIEFPEIYDGLSAWLCPTCGHWQHRWPEGDTRRDRTARRMPEMVAHVKKDRQS